MVQLIMARYKKLLKGPLLFLFQEFSLLKQLFPELPLARPSRCVQLDHPDVFLMY